MASSTNQTQQGEDQETASEVVRSTSDKTILLSANNNLPNSGVWAQRDASKLFQGFWIDDYVMTGLPSLREKFRGKSDHVVLTSHVKSGATWLKALLFSIMNRSSHCSFRVGDGGNNNPLASCNPHVSVPFLEFYAPSHLDDPTPEDQSSLLSTHLPHSLLPRSMIESGCKFVHVMREPKDVLVSLWHFSNKLRNHKGMPPLTFDDAFDMFCSGYSPYGPYWDYEVEYWNASMKCPDRFFVMTYEDLMERPVHYVKKFAVFVGKPFTDAEEERGVAEDIVSFCSFDKLSNLEVNKRKTSNVGLPSPVQNEVYFRKAQVGDWKNHLSEEKRERIDQITYSKFKGTGLPDLVST